MYVSKRFVVVQRQRYKQSDSKNQVLFGVDVVWFGKYRRFGREIPSSSGSSSLGLFISRHDVTSQKT